MKRNCAAIGLDTQSTNLERLKFNGKLFTYSEVHPPRGGIDLTTTPLCPAANEVFSPEEMAERIAYYAARAELRLPLTTRTPRTVA